ncbi:MAG: DUF512 domain-containing protein [Bacillota bacterium]|nr:DUF512 domain-containing protein [Bacillota bacterium]
MKRSRAIIEEVLPHSIGAKYSFKKGDILKSINGKELRDIIDYQLFTAENDLSLVVESNGKERHIELKKSFEDDLGIGFENAVFDGIRHCKNKCLFCFVDQMPKGYRNTLYVKDDDYRLSFLYGNYVTLTNLTEEDFQRIVSDRLSPLYISIHCVDSKMRETLLGVKEKIPLLDNLKYLTEAGIEFNGQIVLTPGYNDGEYLHETIEAVSALGDAVLSLALVPVGLTKHQKNALRPYTKEEAKSIIELTKKWQQTFMAERGTNLLYAADEFYLLADETVPDDRDYEDYPQIENGVGIIRKFYNDYDYCRDDMPSPNGVKYIIVTGVDGGKALAHLVEDLKDQGHDICLLPVKNSFFGETVTVTGLLTGGDIIKAINEYPKSGATFLIPDILLKFHTDLLLDDVHIDDIAKDTQANIKLVETSAYDLLEAISVTGE